MIIKSLQAGLAQMRANKRMLIVFYLSNLFFGLILMLPFRGVLSNFVGNSKMGEKLAGRFDMNFLFEFVENNDQIADMFGTLVPLVPIIFWLFLLFLSGGAFAVFAGGDKYMPAAFWGGCAGYFGRFIRLVLWSLPVGAVLFCLQFLVPLFQKLFFGSDPYQNITYWGGWIKFGLRYISIILFALLLDYARIHAVMTDERKMRLSVWNALKFIYANFLKAFGLAFLLFLIGVVMLVVYNLIADTMSAPAAFVVILLLLFQQTYMIARMMLRLTVYSSQLNLFRGLSVRKPAAVEAEEGDVGIEGAPA
ncbi:MAG: hypothetical protein V3U73_00810 [bacterium]